MKGRKTKVTIRKDDGRGEKVLEGKERSEGKARGTGKER